MDHSIGIRHFLIFTRTSLMRAASFAASQSARRWSDGEKAHCFFTVRSDANGTLQTIAAPQQFVCYWTNSGHRYEDRYTLSVQKRRIKWTEDFSLPLPPQLLLRLLCPQSPKKVEQNRYRNTLPRR